MSQHRDDATIQPRDDAINQPRDPWEGTLLFPPTSDDTDSSCPEPPPPPSRQAGQLPEHRGEIIITLAFISLFPIFGLFAIGAVAMAITDLRKMARGEMDPAGRKQTIAGLLIGSIELLIILFAVTYWLLHG